MTDKPNTWVERLKNPALWLTVLGVMFYVTIRLDKVDVLEQRLDKYIERHNKLNEENEQLRHVIKDMELEFYKLHYEQELKINNNE
jgi:hypothetical protein